MGVTLYGCEDATDIDRILKRHFKPFVLPAWAARGTEQCIENSENTRTGLAVSFDFHHISAVIAFVFLRHSTYRHIRPAVIITPSTFHFPQATGISRSHSPC